MRNRFLIFFIFILSCSAGVAQQAPLFSQYVLNEFVLNPAVAGVDATTSISIIGRKQWLGWEFAPENYSASIAGRILKSPKKRVKRKTGAGSLQEGASGRVGLGGSILTDRNGAVNKTSVNFTYAYHLPFHNSQLSFGLTFMANQFRIDEDYAEVSDPNDPVNAIIGSSTFSPDAALGVNYSSTKYHAGFSIFNLFQSPVKIGETSIDYRELQQERHYYFLATYKDKFSSNPKWSYEPSFVGRGTEQFKGTLEASMRLIYQDEYWCGLSVRTTKDIILLLGLKLNNFYFGYSFDYGFNEIAQLSYGSHEVVMAIKLGDSTKRYRYWERY